MARNFHHKVTVVKVNKGVARFLIVRKAKAIGIPAIVYLAKIVKAVAKLVNKTFGWKNRRALTPFAVFV